MGGMSYRVTQIHRCSDSCLDGSHDNRRGGRADWHAREGGGVCANLTESGRSACDDPFVGVHHDEDSGSGEDLAFDCWWEEGTRTLHEFLTNAQGDRASAVHPISNGMCTELPVLPEPRQTTRPWPDRRATWPQALGGSRLGPWAGASCQRGSPRGQPPWLPLPRPQPPKLALALVEERRRCAAKLALAEQVVGLASQLLEEVRAEAAVMQPNQPRRAPFAACLAWCCR